MLKSRSPTPSVRPRDAATLIVVRRGRRGLACLMGRRREDARFLPGCFVFPGGAVESADRVARPASRLDLAHLGAMGVGGNAAAATTLAIAAVRETWEETEVMIAAPGDVGPAPGATFDEMRRRGVAPALGRLVYLGRAITPACHPIRFHARFFLTLVGHGRGGLHGDDSGVDGAVGGGLGGGDPGGDSFGGGPGGGLGSDDSGGDSFGGGPGSDGSGGDGFGGGGSGGSGSDGESFGGSSGGDGVGGDGFSGGSPGEDSFGGGGASGNGSGGDSFGDGSPGRDVLDNGPDAGDLGGDGELDRLSWVPLADVASLPTIDVTRFMAGFAGEIMNSVHLRSAGRRCSRCAAHIA